MTTRSDSSLSYNADEVSAAFEALRARMSAIAMQEPTPQSVALLRSLIAEIDRYDEAAALAAVPLRTDAATR